MASTNKTANYELSQFEGTDKPSWEADYNADMLAIDTNLKAVSDVANGASGDISTLDGRLTTAEDNISTNANDIDALEGRADALEARQTSDDGRLDTLEAEQIVQNTAIESNTRLGYNLARPYDSASTYSVGAYVLFQDTLYKCMTAVTTGESFDPSKWLAIKATDEIAAGGYTLPIASASQLGGVKIGDGLSIDPVSGILNNSSKLEINNLTTTQAYTIENSSAVIYDMTGAPTPATLNNLSFVTSATLQNAFIATINNLKIVKLPFDISFDSITVPANNRLRVNITATMPSFLGTPLKTDNYFHQAFIQGTEEYSYTVELKNNKMTISFYMINNRNTGVAFNGDTRGLITATMIYLTS